MENNQINRTVHIQYVNEKKIQQLSKENNQLKKKLNVYKNSVYKIAIITATVASIINGIAGYQLRGAINKANYQVPMIPDDCIAMDLNVVVEYGDTVSDIASRYYNDNYENMYGEFNHYVDAVLDKNNLEDFSKLQPGDNLKVPVIFQKDNKFYMESTYLQHQIDEVKENAYWVPHTVTYSDGSISYLAAQASGSDAEVGVITSQIQSHNGLKDSRIQVGQQLEIVNPELGPLKVSLNEAKENLNESIQNNSKEK